MEAPPSSPTVRAATVGAGLAGALLLAIASPYDPTGSPLLLLDLPLQARPDGLAALVTVATPIAATAGGLLALRRWPWLLLAGALLMLPWTLREPGAVPPVWLSALLPAARPLAVIGVFAAAQALVRRGHAGLGAMVAGAGAGAALLGSAAQGGWWLRPAGGLCDQYVAFAGLAVIGAAAAAWVLRRGDPAARPEGRRLRPVVAGGLAVAVAFPLGLLTNDRLAVLIGVSRSALDRHDYAQRAVIGAIVLAVAAGLAAVCGPWVLGGALTVAAVQVAAVAPMLVAVLALHRTTLPWLAVLAGPALGAALAATRWRFAFAGAVTAAAAVALVIAYAATLGNPGKLTIEPHPVAGTLIAVLVTAAATAVVGSAITAVAPTGAAPAALGPLAGMVALGGLQTMTNTSTEGNDLTVSTWLLLAAAAGAGGLGLARQWAARRAERRLAEQIRREAAEAERNRLARPIHDGVLQVLALVQRHGAELGGTGAQLATLAGEQEAALRSLLSGGPVDPAGARPTDDLRTALTALASATIEVAAPADAVPLPPAAAGEVTAAVHAALDNVRRHAGPDARAWVLLEDEGDGVRVTVRDNGAGFEPARLAEAEGEGRLGVAQSIRGRIADLGGTTDIFSRPGQGTEVEFWVPRRR